MDAALRTLRAVRIALLVSIVLYAFVGEQIARPATRPPNPLLFYVLTFVAVTTVGMVFFMRRLFVFPAQADLATQPGNGAALNRWRSGYVLTYALSEAVALFGFILRMLGFSLSQILPFYIAAFALILLFAPRVPSNEIG